LEVTLWIWIPAPEADRPFGDAAKLQQQLQKTFPQRVPGNVREGCKCEECESLRRELTGKTWSEVPAEFVRQYEDSLPLLTPDAYTAFLPAWLREGIRDPKWSECFDATHQFGK
jgi:hypothetical protein